MAGLGSSFIFQFAATPGAILRFNISNVQWAARVYEATGIGVAAANIGASIQRGEIVNIFDVWALVTYAVARVPGAAQVVERGAQAGASVLTKFISTNRAYLDDTMRDWLKMSVRSSFGPETGAVRLGGPRGPRSPFGPSSSPTVPGKIIDNPVTSKPRVGHGEKGTGSGNKLDPVEDEPVRGPTGQPIPVGFPTKKGKSYAAQEFPSTTRAHGFPDIVDNYAGDATSFKLSNGATLYQVEGSLSGVEGRFEWIVDPSNGGVTHRYFVKSGTVSGIPTQP